MSCENDSTSYHTASFFNTVEQKIRLETNKKFFLNTLCENTRKDRIGK